MWVVILNKVIRADFTEMVSFEQRLKEVRDIYMAYC